MRVNPLVLMSELLILLILIFGLRNASEVAGQSGASASAPAMPDPIHIAPTELEDQTPERVEQGEGSAGLVLRLQEQGELILGDGVPVQISDVQVALRERQLASVTLVPGAGVPYQKVYEIAWALSRQGIPVDLSSEVEN